MRRLVPLSSLLFLCWSLAVSHAQSLADTILSIPQIEITATAIRQQPAGSATQKWQEAQLSKSPAANLADLLSMEAGTYVKNYGAGSVATSSVRGGSAGHTLILWNGLPVQNPMLGLSDLSLLPVQAATSISFTRGGNAALWGSGAIGGVLSLDNKPDFSQRVKLESITQGGSFGHFQQQLKIGLGNEKFQSATRISHQRADNDFYYFVAAGLPERQQTNARFSQQLLMQDFYWKINHRHRLTLHFWGQQTGRQIPPTLVQSRSEAHQDDLAARIMLEYRYLAGKGLLELKTGYFDERLNYFDDQILLESRSRFRTFLAEITAQRQWGRSHHLFVGNTHTFTQAWSAGYRENIPSEYRTALFASWKFQRKKFSSQASLRQEMADGKLLPTLPALGMDWQLHPSLTLKGKISRNYRLPTLNDRFWMPGGNPDLLPESGWSQELGLAHQMELINLKIEVSLTAFNRSIDNWILWSLREGQSFWSANNITRVWSRGLEPRFSVAWAFKDVHLTWKGGYDYIRSTNQVALENPKMEKGDQLIYTPVHQAFSVFSLEWKALYLAYQHACTGPADGINEALNAFQTGHVRLQYSGSIQKYKGTIFFNIYNIWDADYLVVERRPMPGIHFHAGIHLIFHQNSKS
ncbi:MAG: TonB-dependent receptor [Saprospiraceae bacterium]